MVTPLSVATTSSPLPSLSPVPIALAISCLISLAFSIGGLASASGPSARALRLGLGGFGLCVSGLAVPRKSSPSGLASGLAASGLAASSAAARHFGRFGFERRQPSILAALGLCVGTFFPAASSLLRISVIWLSAIAVWRFGLGLGRRLDLLASRNPARTDRGRIRRPMRRSPGRKSARRRRPCREMFCIDAGVGGDLGKHGVRIGEQMLVGILLLGLGILRVGDLLGAALALAFGARRRVKRLRLFGLVADRVRAVADILQALAAGVAVDQLDRVEIAGDRRLGLLVGGVDQPHHQEEAHHGGHEIGKGDLPDAAVMGLVMVAMRVPDDDDLVRVLVGVDRAHASTPATAADHSASRVS